MVSKWMNKDKKDLSDNLTKNDEIPVFLLMEQAINTRWGCPRAKVLVKLHEGTSESSEVQTIRRIRRMPEAVHYEDNLLNLCYVYTFDEKYKAGLLADMDKAYEIYGLFSKDKCETSIPEKGVRDQDFDSPGEHEVLNKIYGALAKKHGLNGDEVNNKMRFMAISYQFGNEIIGYALYGRYIRTDTIIESCNYYATRERVNTHRHSVGLLHCVGSIRSTIGMAIAKVRTILERLFCKGSNSYRKLLSLDTTGFYTFIVNNEHRLEEGFREVTSSMAV